MSFIIAYFIVRSVVPEIHDELENLLHGLFYIAVLTIILGLPRVVFSGNDKKIMDLTKRIRKKEFSGETWVSAFVLSHNTIRGGAGGSILNAELALNNSLL